MLRATALPAPGRSVSAGATCRASPRARPRARRNKSAWRPRRAAASPAPEPTARSRKRRRYGAKLGVGRPQPLRTRGRRTARGGRPERGTDWCIHPRCGDRERLQCALARHAHGGVQLYIRSPSLHEVSNGNACSGHGAARAAGAAAGGRLEGQACAQAMRVNSTAGATWRPVPRAPAEERAREQAAPRGSRPSARPEQCSVERIFVEKAHGAARPPAPFSGWHKAERGHAAADTVEQ